MPEQNYPRSPITRALEKAWRYLRQVTGDAAYENYVKYCAAKESNSDPAATAIMTRAEFYRDALKRKYSTINRCC
jgi:uncharacterized short protein YbdD (DUF466 family)